jgi:hypothetical protein
VTEPIVDTIGRCSTRNVVERIPSERNEGGWGEILNTDRLETPRAHTRTRCQQMKSGLAVRQARREENP